METELNFLKRGYQYCKNIIFPLTKKDMNADYQVIAEDNRKKIHQLLDIPEEAVQLIPVSSVAKQRYLKSGSKSMYTNSNFPQLEEAIWTMIARTRGGDSDRALSAGSQTGADEDGGQRGRAVSASEYG